MVFPVAHVLGQQCPTTLVGSSEIGEIWHTVASVRGGAASVVVGDVAVWSGGGLLSVMGLGVGQQEVGAGAGPALC